MDKKLLSVNGVPTTVVCDPSAKLADVLRRQLGLTGTKVACGQGQSGSCSVILNGKVVRSCTTTMKRVPAESQITTIEGIGTPDRPLGPFGASGCGESPLTAPHAAIINAIDNACGARVRHLPALPDKVLASMKEDIQAW